MHLFLEYTHSLRSHLLYRSMRPDVIFQTDRVKPSKTPIYDADEDSAASKKRSREEDDEDAENVCCDCLRLLFVTFSHFVAF